MITFRKFINPYTAIYKCDHSSQGLQIDQSFVFLVADNEVYLNGFSPFDLT